MKCPHCGIAYHDNWSQQRMVYADQFYSTWEYRIAICPGCKGAAIEVRLVDRTTRLNPWRMIHPIGAARGPVPASVPAPISSDYVEACNVLPISPKASAALSRRCLQNILHDNGYKSRDLSREIEAFLKETDPAKVAPQSLRDVVDGIRNFGNFSAHPVNDVSSTQIIEIEPAEAEWCLEILEEMFQHFYERPAQAAARKAALNAKLAAAGKPPAK